MFKQVILMVFTVALIVTGVGCRDSIFLGFPDGGLIHQRGEIYQKLKKS